MIIFEADTPAGKAFDITLLVLIVLSVTAVMLESVTSIRSQYGTALEIAEWTFTILFTIEYVLRILSVRRPARYARSFFGIVDILSILPTYLELLLPGGHFLSIVRILRLLRLFRIFKMARYIGGAELIIAALRASRPKITVFFFAVISLAVVMGALMYVVEGSESQFSSIPKATYWAIVTITTVGYGDIAPQTGFGQFLASIAMLCGYAVLAVPTGIVGAEISRQMKTDHAHSTRSCPSCGRQGHRLDAKFCRLCGDKLS